MRVLGNLSRLVEHHSHVHVALGMVGFFFSLTFSSSMLFAYKCIIPVTGYSTAIMI